MKRGSQNSLADGCVFNHESGTERCICSSDAVSLCERSLALSSNIERPPQDLSVRRSMPVLSTSQSLRRNTSSAAPRSRKPFMYLSPFPSIGAPLDPSIDVSIAVAANEKEVAAKPGSEGERPQWLRPTQSWPCGSSASTNGSAFGVVPLLTPPEELSSFSWTPAIHKSAPARQESLSTNSEHNRATGTGRSLTDLASVTRPSTISLPDHETMPEQGSTPTTWLNRAVQTIGMLILVLVQIKANPLC